MAATGLEPTAVLESTSSGTKYELNRALGAGAFGQVWVGTVQGGEHDGEQRALKIMPCGAAVRQEGAVEVRNHRRAMEVATDAFVPRLFEATAVCIRRKSMEMAGDSPVPGLSESVVIMDTMEDGEREGEQLGLNSHKAMEVDSDAFVAATLRDQATVALPDYFLIAMEWVQGQSAGYLARTAPGMPEDFARVVLASITEGLKKLHRHGVVHSDIKGDNVLVSTSGAVKLCDFGIAVLPEDSEKVAAQVAGTPYFMPPEVVHGGGRGAPADIWSLGIMAVELAVGHTPWQNHVGDHKRHLLLILGRINLLNCGAYMPDGFANSEFSALYREFVLRCLHGLPAERATAQQLVESELLHVPRITQRHFQAWAARRCG